MDETSRQRLAEAETENQMDWFEVAVSWLTADGVQVPPRGQRPAGWQVLILEAVNWAAKAFEEGYYTLKAKLADQLAEDPAFFGEAGWTPGGTFAIWHPNVGTVHIHDPNCEVVSRRVWNVEWSGICRQFLVSHTLTSARLRRALALATAPGRRWGYDEANQLVSNLLVGPVGPLP